METLQLLGVTLGLASLAGINLYLTVFLTGLAVRLEWISLVEPYTSLSILADPVILTISGLFFLLEFFADKIPWVDSIWDSVHTFIRPVGAALLGIQIFGDSNPVFDVAVGLLAGGTALTTHGVKATTRLFVNASPEPFSNIALSLAEDGLVFGGLALLLWNPLVALGLVALFLGCVVFFGPRLLRVFRSRLGFAWKKLMATADVAAEKEFIVPVELDCLLHQQLLGEVRVEWCLPATSGKIPKAPANLSGWLLALREPQDMLYWCGKVGFRLCIFPVKLDGHLLKYSHGFLFDKVSISHPETKEDFILLIDRTTRTAAERALKERFEPDQLDIVEIQN